MVSQKTTVINKSGIHARPASELAKVCSKCESDIIISVGEKRLNPKSILNLMAAAIRCGTDIVVECTGETEEEDLKKIIDVIASGLGE
ncbi:MAG: HPr family phosphocarrier protein [Herbinix sp.]|jgi:phosphocarrier protein|nr:HPr family phosphocarrier protein [Herbinix sp.]